jgi:ribonuclease HI
MKQVTIYTDGACDPNPGVGGWAAILIHDGHEREISGGDSESTNNRMELTAVIEALRALKEKCDVTIFTDSEYVKNAFTQKWIDGWIKKGWKTASRQPVKNQDLWRTLIDLVNGHQVKWEWVRGHADDPLNNRCDELAVQARLAVARNMKR